MGTMARTIRDLLVLGALAVGAFGIDRRGTDAGARDKHNVILVVADGLRWQEVFRGADSLIMLGHADQLGPDAAAVRQRWWRPSVHERRRTLMPFLWNTVAREGQLIGNRDAASRVSVTNGMNFSYPGYNELLTGRPDGRIDRNDYGPNPNVTVFEWMNGRDDLRGHVAVVGAWDAFEDIFNVDRSGLPLHASRADPIDRRSHLAALRFLRERQPRALFVAYVETDDAAHSGRYDQLLDRAHDVDRYLAELWRFVQSHPRYRGRTTLIVTADHGRGRTPADWMHHGEKVAGAHETWVVVIGPLTRASGVHRGGYSAALAQVAATVAASMRLDYRGSSARAARPIPGVVE